MTSKILRHAAIAAVAALAALAALPALAQKADWPARPVRFVVPFPPGGTVDPLARLVGAKLTPVLGQQFIVDNRTGASGSIGAGIAARATPDGYTYLFVFDTHAVNPFLIPNLPYDTQRDLAPVMLVATAPYGIVSNVARPYRTFGDVIKAARAKSDSVTFGSVGSGSLGHLLMTLMQQAGGFKLVHVPYKGGGPMTVAAMGGDVELAVGTVALLTPFVKGGKLRPVATTGDKRASTLPDVATVAEQGFPGFSAVAWWGILATGGTPKPIVDRFHAELVKVFNQPDVRKQLVESLGMDLVVSSPAELQKFIISEMARWEKVVRAHKIRAD